MLAIQRASLPALSLASLHVCRDRHRSRYSTTSHCQLPFVRPAKPTIKTGLPTIRARNCSCGMLRVITKLHHTVPCLNLLYTCGGAELLVVVMSLSEQRGFVIIRLGSAHARQSIVRAYSPKPRTPEGMKAVFSCTTTVLLLRGLLHSRRAPRRQRRLWSRMRATLPPFHLFHRASRGPALIERIDAEACFPIAIL